MSKRQFRTNWDYLNDIADAVDKLRQLTQDMTYDSFQDDWRTYHAAFSLLEIVGEASGRITSDFQAQHPAIPWGAMRGMRNALIHGYASVELDVVWDTLQQDIPRLNQQIRQVLNAHTRAVSEDELER